MSKSSSVRGPLRDEYTPRHIRLKGGTFDESGPHSVAVREVVSSVPILSDSGVAIAEKKVVVLQPAHEAMSQYRLDDFKIDNLLAAGVKLSEIDFELNSRVANDSLVAKAINLGLLSEEFSPVPVSASVESSNSENHD